MLLRLPAKKFYKDAKDFAAQLWKHRDGSVDQPVARANSSAFGAELTDRILSGRGGLWMDGFKPNVASRACEVLGRIL